jgi:nitrite reductase/ring-hydroxylating ferredoxin subunit
LTWHPLTTIDAFSPGEAREFIVAGRIVALFNVDGEFFALDGLCPHQGGPLGKGTLSGCVVTCPWHGFQFNVRTGEHQNTPNLREPQFATKVEAGHVYVELADQR